MNEIQKDKKFQERLQERFLRYVKIVTTSSSDLGRERCPSTEEQWELLNLLKQELQEMRVKDISLDKNGFLIARLPAKNNAGKTIGFMAHVDTANDVIADAVNPQVHAPYDGEVIKLKEGVILDPEDFPLLRNYKGDTVITTDGTSLLGADDKAGVAILMNIIEYLQSNEAGETVDHPELEFIFTPDEETGHGMNYFPLDQVRCQYAYTLDGGTEGEIEEECYTAYHVQVECRGIVIHPGSARGKLVNAVSMANSFIQQLPRSESPEATDGHFGNFWVHRIEGTLETCAFEIHMRDFTQKGMERRIKVINSIAESVRNIYDGGEVVVSMEEVYRNMKERLSEQPEVMQRLKDALRQTGMEPIINPIRGGTDGSRLTQMGIPCPNIFTGGQNFHGRKEWVALSPMMRSAQTVLNLIQMKK